MNVLAATQGNANPACQCGRTVSDLHYVHNVQQKEDGKYMGKAKLLSNGTQQVKANTAL